jgi:AraC family transcriptional regulator, regulatory protein of adaptative response / methylated-DNA-[protein]-cysteine methyltransferase
MSDYERIERAIAYIADHVVEQPRLEDVAAHLHLSPYHFQRLFRRWAGTTPKRFLQVMTLERSKQLLNESGSLLDLTGAVGLSSSSRLHEHFVRIEAMTPGDYARRGEGLAIRYGCHETPFGNVFIALTARGICRVAFVDGDNLDECRAELETSWPMAALHRDDAVTLHVAEAMAGATPPAAPLTLQVTGTNFQLAVWRALLTVPPGAVVSYARLAGALGRPQSARAVGNAVAANPIAVLIPCHRVIRTSGALGDYRWGQARKRTIQAWERVRLDPGTA